MSLRPDWPIVIGGCHRSGTSLLRRILDAHPRIHCGPEVLFLRDFYGEYREDPLAHLRFSRTARSILPEDELLEVLGGAFVEIHARAARRAGKQRWADKAPENVLHAGTWDRLLGDEWLLVHVVRDPRDVVSSMRERPMPATLPPDDAGRLEWYRRYVQAGLDAVAQRPGRARVLLYEDLVARPRDTVAGLMAWLGEAFDPVQMAFNAEPHQTGLEDPKVAATDAVHGDGVGRWASALSEEEAQRVVDGAGGVWRRAQEAAATSATGDPGRRRRRTRPERARAVLDPWLRDGPVVIGATGGSGTRAVARMVRRAGVHLGEDLNPAEDRMAVAGLYDRWLNPWLAEPDAVRDELLEDLVPVLAEQVALLPPSAPWGWKEPRTLYLLPLLAREMPALRVVHVIRDGRDMAFSRNQNQLRKHGRLLLGDGQGAAVTPERSMALWARLNQQAADLGERRLGARYLRVRFEDLCAAPRDEARRILRFLGSGADPDELAAVVEPPPSLGRWRVAEAASAERVEEIGRSALARFGYAPAARRTGSAARAHV